MPIAKRDKSGLGNVGTVRKLWRNVGGQELECERMMKGACFRKIAPLYDQLQYTCIVCGFLLMIYWRTEALMISP